MKESSIKVGDTVLVKQKRRNKLTSRFNKTPYVVIQCKGTQVIAENDQKHRVKRNVSHFKKFENTVDRSEETESELEDELVGNDNDLENEHKHKHENEREPVEVGNRWPRREHRPPERFGHSVPSNLIP